MDEKKYFTRNIDRDLLAWSTNPDRKPLLLRGARQVGKSSAIRIEVKAGTQGAMQSLHLFMNEKKN